MTVHFVEISGMTGDQAAAEIERKLNSLPGIKATVLYSMSHAKIVSQYNYDVDHMCSVIERMGYNVKLSRIEPA